MIAKAPISIVITTQTSKTTSRYGQRGEKYVLIDVGFTGENIYLQAQTLNLGTVAVGAFSQTAVAELLNLTTGETPVLIMPVGKR
jgi:SagB-type dehydrogenase family enzyme